MADRYRTTISLSHKDKERAQKRLDRALARRRLPQNMRLPAYLALLIERQLLIEEAEDEASATAERLSPRRKRARSGRAGIAR